jgi:hypothetical protein
MKIPLDYISFYDSIEKIDFFDEWSILDSLKSIVESEDDFYKNIITERKFFSHFICDGLLKTNYRFTDNKGKEVKPKIFDEDEIKYLTERISQTNNFILKAKYSQITWQITKHNKYARLSIDNYIEVVNTKKFDDFQEFCKVLSCLLYISNKIKYREDEVKLFSISIFNQLKIWQKKYLLDLLLKTNSFKLIDLKSIILDTPNWANENYFFNKDCLLLSVDLFKKLNLESFKLYELLSKNEDLIISQHQKDSDFIKFKSIGQKCIYLKKSNNDKEYQKCLKLYNSLKKTVNLSKISYSLEPKVNDIINSYNDQLTDFLFTKSTDEIFYFFCLNETFLVDGKQCEDTIINKQQDSFRKSFSFITFDINLNFKELDDDEKFKKEVLESYSLEFNIRFFVLFYKVFRRGIAEGKISYKKTYSFLESNTWYIHKFDRKLRSNEIEEETNWLTLIAPGLYDFFNQFELSMLLNTNRIGNYILALDSLTLKFEGALRDFIRLCGGSTTKIVNENTQEQLLEDLINNEKIKELFSEKDIELFVFAFTKKGRDIRNNIAHSFFAFSDYSLQNVALIILCFLRLGKYKFTEQTKNNS